LQNPFALTPTSPAHSPVLIEIHYITGVNSAMDPNVNTYKIYMYLSHDINHKTRILTILNNQPTQMQSVGLPTSPEELDALHVEENSTYRYVQHLMTKPLPTQLRY